MEYYEAEDFTRNSNRFVIWATVAIFVLLFAFGIFYLRMGRREGENIQGEPQTPEERDKRWNETG